MTRPQSADGAESPTGSPSDSLAIEAEDVHVTYADGTEAVRGVSLAVPEGEFFGFLGPNGAGKTTTIKTLVTLLSPTGGSVRVNGFDTRTEPRAVRESIGYMAQETSIDLELTPRENLRVACRMYGVPEDERDARIADLLELVDLADVADRRAETFSGGMQKRLDTATVLVHRPPVVFLDEPTTGLDPEARLRVWNYVERINDRGTTVFLTTQYLEEADRLCDRLAVLQDGRVTHRGTPAELKTAAGTDTVTLRLARPTAPERRRAVEAVRSTAGLDVARLEETGERLRFEAAGARRATSDLFAALADRGVDVRDFAVDAPTLDDAFLALTDEDADGSTDTSENEDAPVTVEASR